MFHRKNLGNYWLLKHDKNMQRKDVVIIFPCYCFCASTDFE